ncbi:MAG: isochorismatase family protein [Alphaproteobacteria bacterium]|nr:isochorismatase family protein [Alphaproteobacteria bacterium]MBN2780057.1 isochorismatase family protein [Alphaproteobacteria bacterium]
MKAALLIVDVQKDYDKDGALEISDLRKSLPQIQKLLQFYREKDFLRVHVRHVSLDPKAEDFCDGTKGVEFIDGFEPDANEIVITKNYPGSFWKTKLDDILKKNNIDTVLICGYSSFLCCDTTAREAFQHGYAVFYVEDAIGEFKIGDFSTEQIHAYTCAVQQDSGFSTVLTVDDVIKK